ncbi:MAG: hypothetical protein WC080_03530 [Patescibacteria group bacterium]|jgi:Flp pilus assembly protein TadD
MILVVVLCGIVIGYWRYSRVEESSPASTQEENLTSENIDSNSGTTDNFDNKGQATSEETKSSNNIDQSDPYSLYEAGEKNLNQKNYVQALDYFDKALLLRQDDAKFYIGKSQALAGLQRKQDAIKVIEQGLDVLPNNEDLKTQLDILQNVVQ